MIYCFINIIFYNFLFISFLFVFGKKFYLNYLKDIAYLFFKKFKLKNSFNYKKLIIN